MPDDPEELLMREMLLESYREIVPEVSIHAAALCRKLASGLVARGGRILIGPRPVAQYQVIHHSTDRQRRIVWTCKEWHQTLGFPPRHAIGQLIHNFLSPDSIAFDREWGWPALLRGEVVGPVAVSLISADGRRMTGIGKAEPLHDSKGAFLRTFTRIRLRLQ